MKEVSTLKKYTILIVTANEKNFIYKFNTI